ncbi:hypothetical protein cypCar_00003576 [Cyprinus carpio]|nr:hypothetical protein cypCar_00003576 [Cyprinus carpio]
MPAAALLSPRKAIPQEVNAQTQSSFARTLSPVKTPMHMSPGTIKAATSSSHLSNSQEILKDVAEMKEDLIRMSAILQTDTNSSSKGYHSDSKEHKVEDEEPFKIVEKVKQDLVKVSEILSKDVLRESKANIKNTKTEYVLEDDIDDNAQNEWRCPPRYETLAPQVKTKPVSERDFNLAKVVDYLTNDIGTSSLSKIAEAKQRTEEARREGEEKQKRVLKPAMALQEHKLKMPPTNMRPSPSEKELSKLADALFGPEIALDSPDDVSHDQDKSPLSDSGFETRSERTPSAPQSAEGMGPKGLFQEIPPVITETRTEVVHVIRSYEPPENSKEPALEDARMTKPPLRCTDTEPRSPGGSIKERVKAYQARVNAEDDVMSKGMRVKEETHITTTTRMVYHKPPIKEVASERMEETVSVRDIMKAFQSGKDPSRELTGLFEHKTSSEGADPSIRPLDPMPKVERIIEVHIEKGNKAEPTEVIIRETKNHPEKEMYIYQGKSGMKELQNRLGSEQHESIEPEESLPCYLDSRIHMPVSVEDDKTLKLLSQQSVEYHDDESSETRGESYKFAEKMLLSDKFDSSHSDSDESVIDRSRYYVNSDSSRQIVNIVCNGVDDNQVEYIEKVTPGVTADIKPLPVYVSIQKQPPSLQGSPEDDTLEQVTFMDSSGKTPVTPEMPTSEEVSYDLNSRAPEPVIGSMAGMPSPIPEESEEEEQLKTFIFREVSAEKAKSATQTSEPSKRKQDSNGKKSKDKRIAYIEFPPPPPLETEHADPEKRGSCPSSEAETEMMEVNLQEEHDRHLLAEPVIRVQPPSPLPPGADNSDSSDDESVFQPAPLKKYTFKMAEECEKCVKPRKPERNSSQHKESGINGTVKGEEIECEQNGNDQSITDCSIATTAEFSHDTDATEIDSLDGYDLQDEDDGLSGPKTSSLSIEGKAGDRSFSQSKLEVIEEESTPNEETGEKAKTKRPSGKKSDNGKEETIYSLEGRHPDRQGFADNYFKNQLEECINTTFKTVATKGLDFDPWSGKVGEEGAFDAKNKDEDPKPCALSVEDKSQATTPDTTPARTPTDESTPTSEPNPFPFHEGKMFEMTRSGAIDMSKRDFVEERLQFFQIGEHTSDGQSGDKGKGGRNAGVVASHSKAGERAVEGKVEATTDLTPSRGSTVQGSTDCLDAPTFADSTSCTVTASKVDPKLRTPIKMGIAASITIKKDTGSAELTDVKTESSDSQMLEYISLESQLAESHFDSRRTNSSLAGRKDYPSENYNNNNNLESSNVQANYIHCGSVVFNLQSSSEPTLQKASRIEAQSCRESLEKAEKASTESPQAKIVSENRQPKSRLPVKAAGFSFDTLSSGKQKPKQVVRPEARKVDPASIMPEPKSRIPVKDIKRNGAANSAVTAQVVPRSSKLPESERSVRPVVPSKLPFKDRSCGVTEASKGNFSEVCRQSIEFLKNVSGEAIKAATRASDGKTTQESSSNQEAGQQPHHRTLHYRPLSSPTPPLSPEGQPSQDKRHKGRAYTNQER